MQAACTETPLFQSTLPTRGETAWRSRQYRFSGYFNPLSPHGERPTDLSGTALTYEISIHSPHTGRDLSAWGGAFLPLLFQSTLPTRGETAFARAGYGDKIISIHSPHTGRDGLRSLFGLAHIDFNPLSPHGERRFRFISTLLPRDFNPLSPHGERPFSRPSTCFLCYFNPLSPHGERLKRHSQFGRNFYFNPLSPHGERPVPHSIKRRSSLFQSTLPTRGETCTCSSARKLASDFNPLSPHGERQYGTAHSPAHNHFNPLSPHGERRSICLTSTCMQRISIHSPHTGRDS